MGKEAPSAPPPPDPTQVANAQAAANEQTARTTAALNRYNDYTPLGSRTWQNLGNDVWNSVTTLSPNQQALQTGSENLGIGLTGLANNQLPRVQGAMNTEINTAGLPDPIGMQGDIIGEANQVGQDIYDRGMTRLQPQFDRNRNSTYQMLADRGIGAGSGDAWTNVLGDQGRLENDAMVQLSSASDAARGGEHSRLTSLAQALRSGNIQEQDYLRSLPISDISRLMGSSPAPTMPQFQATPGVNVGATDVAGPIYSSYNAQVQQANQARQSQNSGLGSLFGLGSSLLGGWATGGFGLPKW